MEGDADWFSRGEDSQELQDYAEFDEEDYGALDYFGYVYQLWGCISFFFLFGGLEGWGRERRIPLRIG